MDDDSSSANPNNDQLFRTDHLKVNLGSRTARGGAVTLVSQAVKFVASMIATVVLARLLTPEDYGLIGMIAVVTGFISIFKDLGLAQATIQRETINDQQISTLFWVNIGLSLTITMITAAIAPAVAWFYREPRLTSITVIYGMGFLFGGLTVQHEALLRRQMRFVALATSEVVSLAASIVTAIILAWHGARYWALVCSQLSAGFAYAASVWILCGWRPGPPVRNSGITSMLSFGKNLTGFSITNYFARTLDNLLIGKYWGSQQLGLYAKAYQLLLLPIDQINTPVGAVALPALSRLSDSPERYRRAYLRMVEKIAIITMPGMALMIATSDWVVRIVLGPQWAGATRIFALLGFVGMVQPIANTIGWLFITQGRSKHMFQWGMIGSTIIIFSIVIGLPWGALGVAASYSLVFLSVVMPVLFWFAGRSGPVRTMDLYSTIAPFMGASLLSLAAALAFRRWSAVDNPLTGIAFCLLITSVVTLSVLTLIPSGRAALVDIKSALLLLIRRKQETLV